VLLSGPAKLSPLGLRDTSHYPVADQVALKLGDRGENVKE
jgi:hypothetical protein